MHEENINTKYRPENLTIVFYQLFKLIAIYTWENKQFLVSQYNIVFYLKLCVAKPESVGNILFELND